MNLTGIVLLMFLAVINLTDSQNPPVMHSPNRLRNRDQVHDAHHIREHLDGVVDMQQQDQMKEEETQFHYFKLHDYDNNNKLDGIELIEALTHYHKEEDPSNEKRLADEELSQLVDTILKEDDRNNDGYIDYSEFIMSQRE